MRTVGISPCDQVDCLALKRVPRGLNVDQHSHVIVLLGLLQELWTFSILARDKKCFAQITLVQSDLIQDRACHPLRHKYLRIVSNRIHDGRAYAHGDSSGRHLWV